MADVKPATEHINVSGPLFCALRVPGPGALQHSILDESMFLPCASLLLLYYDLLLVR